MNLVLCQEKALSEPRRAKPLVGSAPQRVCQNGDVQIWWQRQKHLPDRISVLKFRSRYGTLKLCVEIPRVL